MDTKAKNILALSLIKGVGASFIKKNLALIDSYIDNFEMLSSIGGKVTLEDLEYNIKKSNKIINECEVLNIEPISILSESYPAKLKEISDPPPVLFLLGNKKIINNAIAIIGSRKSNELGNSIANKVGQYFSKNWSICNGLVDGIDLNSIKNNNEVFPEVIGVLSGGLDFENTSSKITKSLAKLVLENNGLLISENYPSKKEDQFSGSKASRIQAGLSKGIILVQSSIGGGSKYTLKTFSKLNRTLGIIYFEENSKFINDDLFGANRLIGENGIQGISEMCDIKKTSNIRIKKIINIKSKKNYEEFENLIKIR